MAKAAEHFIHSTKGYNPYMINSIPARKIIFFDASGIVLEHSRGWFGNNRSGNDFKAMYEIPFKMARTLDLSRKYSFCLRHKSRFPVDDGFDLYIYLPAVEGMTIERLGERVSSSDELYIRYADYYRITVTGLGCFYDGSESKEFRSAYYTRTEVTDRWHQLEALKAVYDKGAAAVIDDLELRQKLINLLQGLNDE